MPLNVYMSYKKRDYDGFSEEQLYFYKDCLYMFKNTTDSDLQLNLWVKDQYLYGYIIHIKGERMAYKNKENKRGVIDYEKL